MVDGMQRHQHRTCVRHLHGRQVKPQRLVQGFRVGLTVGGELTVEDISPNSQRNLLQGIECLEKREKRVPRPIESSCHRRFQPEQLAGAIDAINAGEAIDLEHRYFNGHEAAIPGGVELGVDHERFVDLVKIHPGLGVKHFVGTAAVLGLAENRPRVGMRLASGLVLPHSLRRHRC